MSNLPPTPEQQAAIDAFATGESMVIEAGAGTGKTTTLRLMAESTDRRGVYIAYNKAIQTDAAMVFPSNVECRTAHSLAHKGVMEMPEGRRLMRRLGGQKLRSAEQVAILGIPAGGFKLNDKQDIPAWMIARGANETVRRFCNSADDQITERHVPKVEGIEDHAAYAHYVAPYARKAWEDLSSPSGRLNFTHDHYLKVWALSHPRLRCDFVMLDEAQDANPVIARVVEEQTHAQRVMVGDSCQAIYGWRGAIDAMSTFEAPHRLVLSQSFRFGTAVADQANKFLNLLEAPLRLKGFEKIASELIKMTDPNAILCRTNAGVIEYAMSAQKTGKKVAIVGGTTEIKSFTEAAQKLMRGEKVPHPDLCIFDSWAEVQKHAESEEGADIKVMVKLIDNYGVDTVLEVCNNSVNEKGADLIVSTAHKAKGREWDRVLIGSDFKAPEEGAEPSRPEMMLAYVAVTRAKKALDHSGLSWIDTMSEAVA